MARRKAILAVALVAALLATARQVAPATRTLRTSLTRNLSLRAWLEEPGAHPEWGVRAGDRCPGAPLVVPTTGYIGYVWDDSFRVGHRHQGIDIFGGTQPGITAVVAAYPGYLTRRADWVSTVAIRVPDDPLERGRQVWHYYTHMASADGQSLVAAAFPPGSEEVPVDAGTLVGYQGDYAGASSGRIAVHLHFSIVSSDKSGAILSESAIENTRDPLPYIGLGASADFTGGPAPACR